MVLKSSYPFAYMKKQKYGDVMNIDRLREIRKDRDLQQKDIAKILKISQVQYSRYERGIRTIPIDKLSVLAKYYNVSVDYLIGLTNERKPYPKIQL